MPNYFYASFTKSLNSYKPKYFVVSNESCCVTVTLIIRKFDRKCLNGNWLDMMSIRLMLTPWEPDSFISTSNFICFLWRQVNNYQMAVASSLKRYFCSKIPAFIRVQCQTSITWGSIVKRVTKIEETSFVSCWASLISFILIF